jgi:Na+/H+ antiporter NhaA
VCHLTWRPIGISYLRSLLVSSRYLIIVLSLLNWRSGASDAQYHVTWVALFFAMDEFGIRDDTLMSSNINQMETAKRRVMEEALQASLRIAALVSDCSLANYHC